jgi:hypothetical protein
MDEAALILDARAATGRVQSPGLAYQDMVYTRHIA